MLRFALKTYEVIIKVFQNRKWVVFFIYLHLSVLKSVTGLVQFLQKFKQAGNS